MRLIELTRALLTEGGNAFKDEAGNPATQRIHKSDIAPTISWMEKITKLPLVKNTLGSVGKKESSGDLDIAVDENVISKDDLYARLIDWVKSQGVPQDRIINSKSFKNGWVDRSGVSVHFKVPIKGNPANGYVQTDFMFTDDLDWMRFSMFSAGDESRFSGADRNLLMSSIAKSLPGDFKYSWQKGLINRSTGELISKDPDEIAKTILGPARRKEDLDSVETIISSIKKDKKRVSDLANLSSNLKSTDGKKPSQAKLDTEESARIDRAMELLK